MRFKCATCGGEHDLDEISFGTSAPLHWDLLSEDERARSYLSDDLCKIHDNQETNFYIRACLEIPICGSDHFFTWGVWCSLSENSYLEITEHWDDPKRTEIGPHFGWLCTKIPGYPDTVLLKTMVHHRTIGLRPFVEVEPTDHPLAIDQRDGIEENRLKEIVIALLHEKPGSKL